MHIAVLNPKSLYNFDSLMILLFFLWIIENDNEETGDCLDPKGDFFLVFTLYFFKISLWAMSICMFLGTIIIIVLLIKDIVIRVRTRDLITTIGGLSNEEITALPRIKYSKALLKDEEKQEDNNEVCAICLSDFEQNELLIKLTVCNHMFHEACLITWLTKNIFCPYCRRDVRNTNQYKPAELAADTVRLDLGPSEPSPTSNSSAQIPSLSDQISGYQELDSHVVLNQTNPISLELSERV